MYSLTFTIKGLPKILSNARMHWRVRHIENTKWKELVWYHCREQGIPEKPLIRAVLTLTRYSSSSPDFDGLVSSFKSILDGLILAKVLEDDSYEHIGAPTYRWEKVARGTGHIKVTVKEKTPEERSPGANG